LLAILILPLCVPVLIFVSRRPAPGRFLGALRNAISDSLCAYPDRHRRRPFAAQLHCGKPAREWQGTGKSEHG